MNRYRMTTLFLILFLVSFQMFLFACAGLKDVPESERKYVEGVVVEGGVYGVRVKDDNQNILRFITKSGVHYQPAEFHAYCGDRVEVSYYSEMKSGQHRHMALAIKMLEVDPNRPDFRGGTVDGIVRAVGMMRSLVHLPDNSMTVAFYEGGSVVTSPRNWAPKPGDAVKVHFAEDTKRFYKKFVCHRMERLKEKPIVIQDKVITGTVSEILTQRTIHQRPDRFAFKQNNGETLILYTGGETQLNPAGLKVEPGSDYTIEYYSLLLGDQRLRHVATKITR